MPFKHNTRSAVGRPTLAVSPQNDTKSNLRRSEIKNFPRGTCPPCTTSTLRTWKRDQDFSFYASLDLNHNSDKLFRLTNLALNLTSPTTFSSITRCTQVAGFLKVGPNILKILVNHLTMTMMNPFSTKLINNSTKWRLNLRTNLIPPLLRSLKKKSIEPSIPCNWEQHLAQIKSNQNIYAMAVLP